MRAAIYCRVSTMKQADNELSIPDQEQQCEEFCRAKGWTVERRYVDRGASATTDNRPEFQSMIAEACSRDRPIDVILIHSQSRFARNTFDFLFYEKKLAKMDVNIVSITQDFGDGNEAHLLRTMTSVFDEYQSKETAKHVSRSMAANAKQGFWNGAKPPVGYRTYVAEKRGAKNKKKIEIDPPYAELVRHMFDLYVYGDGQSGPLGIRSMIKRINEEGYRTREGRPFRVQTAQTILRNSAYVGRYFLNRHNSRTGKERSREEWIAYPMPRIVSDTIFDAAQARLDQNQFIKTPPRLVRSPILLTGIAYCGKCGNRLKIATGKGNRYRYYKCGRVLDEGKTRCSGVSVPMGKLDEIVLDNFQANILAPKRLDRLLDTLVSRVSDRNRQLTDRITALSADKRQINQQLQNIWNEIGQGLKLDGSLRAHIEGLQDKREQLNHQIDRLEARRDAPVEQLSAQQRRDYSTQLKRRLRAADQPEFRRAYLRTLVERIDLFEDRIRIQGARQALAAGISDFAATKKLVPSFVQEWCLPTETSRTH